jgi:hypothetical protein
VQQQQQFWVFRTTQTSTEQPLMMQVPDHVPLALLPVSVMLQVPDAYRVSGSPP